MKCLIIAAGKGSRLYQKGNPKPLVPILGVPLIERVIRSALEAGMDDFYVVTGFKGEKVRLFLDDLALKRHTKITHVINEAWEEGNALSVLKAEKHLKEKFVLLMADHLFDVDILKDLKGQPLGEGEIALAVDLDTSNCLARLDDVTKVEFKEEKVVNIGKNIKEFNAFDTGIFLSSPVIFQGIKESISKSGDSALSSAVRLLASRGRVKAFKTQGKFWVDVDDPEALDKAEDYLLRHLKGKPADGPVARYINRPLSLRISRHLAKTPVTPNQISLAAFLISLLAAALFMVGGYITLALGGLLAQLASIVDGCDGEISRLKFQASPFGGWFDAVLDRYADAFLLFGLTWHAYGKNPQDAVMAVGFLAIIGSFMLSYTADKYDGLMRERIKPGRSLRLGRDMRLFLIFLGALLNLPFLTLIIIAVIMNAETVRRVIVCQSHG
ncbi:MAG: NTP transferase domain-containing protein [Deltaproteobacteria bacterium]|nr:NTP transferase domain-containing protein [Deltaproteobacteria bacterium]MBW2086694.1 NTP transferase domain-containing protein [Deltaproteobacteria bacterium]